MIFQDPLASLNPCFTVAFQLMETLRIHEGGSARARRARALELLQQVEIPDAAARLDAFPHQLSGGMAQRVMIAMAIACNPQLLIADEPTTALDVTVQAQILDLLVALQRERGMALLLITHDLAVVAETAQRVVVMYAGQQVETGPRAGDLRAAAPSLHAGAAGRAARAQSRPRAAAGDSRRGARASTIGPPAACCRRAAPTRSRAAGASSRRSPATTGGRRAATFRSTPRARPTARLGRVDARFRHVRPR